MQVTPTVSLKQHVQKDVSGTALINVNIPPPKKPGTAAPGATSKSDGP